MGKNSSSKTKDGDENQRNIHSATDREQCQEMAKLNGWTLIRAVPTKDAILKVDCIFEGKQTSFAEDD